MTSTRGFGLFYSGMMLSWHWLRPSCFWTANHEHYTWHTCTPLGILTSVHSLQISHLISVKTHAHIALI